MTWKRLATFALAGAALLTPRLAGAHTPYLLPNAFDAERPRVTLQAALTEDDYFNPDIALNVPVYVETLPSGEKLDLKPTATGKDLTIIEIPLDAPGTYRFSTGGFVARETVLANIGGKWLFVRPPRAGRGPGGGEGGDGPPTSVTEADVPASAPRMEARGVMTVETYVSKGAPTDAALKTSGQGFELKPITHPNAVYVDQGFAFQLTVDGQPIAGVPISVYRAGNIYDDRRIAVQLKTDAKGAGKIAFTQPGVYLLTAQYPAGQRAPGEAPPARSYTYSLTFEVTR